MPKGGPCPTLWHQQSTSSCQRQASTSSPVSCGFDEPLYGMLKGEVWDRDSLREAFQWQLRSELAGNRTVWGSSRKGSWFSCGSLNAKIYPRDVLRCLDLVGVAPNPAHLAVDQVFALQSLNPFYQALLDLEAV